MDISRQIYTDTSKQFVSNPYPHLNEIIDIDIRVINEDIKEVFLVHYDNGEEIFTKMNKKGKCFTTKFTIKDKLNTYYFILNTEDFTYIYTQGGLIDYMPYENEQFKIIADFHNKKWLNDAVFYQIFVDRFNNGDINAKINDNMYEAYGFRNKNVDFNSKPKHFKEDGSLSFNGGDLIGVKNKLDYLKNMGINSIYLNPIFRADSNHKYDCSDYMEVDKAFGGNNSLISLMNKAHDMDMKVILDISINHTGRKHKWLKEHKEYYHDDNNGDVECWLGIKSLPVLNYTNKNLEEEIINILSNYLKPPYSIDGWRFDVAQNVAKMHGIRKDHELWRRIRKEFEKINPNAYILAEYWFPCYEYLQGDMWDGIMNYIGFLRPLRRYLGEEDKSWSGRIPDKMPKKDPISLVKQMKEFIKQVPYQIMRNQFNLINSHDIHRFYNNPIIDEHQYKYIFLLQMIILGVPCIYYGDEILLDGHMEYDAGYRHPFNWENPESHEYYKYMKEIISYKKNSSIISGSMDIFEKNNIFYLIRFDNKEVTVLAHSYTQSSDKLDLSIYGIDKEIEIDFKNNYYFNIWR